MSRRPAGESVAIAGDRMRAEIVPDSGARVVSLRSGGGREWLADSGRDWPIGPPAIWSDGDVRGWDECFPSISPGVHPVTGRALPDHGEVWNEPWRASSSATAIVAEAGLRHHDVRLRRTLTAGPALDARYSVASGEAIEVAWAMHLLLDADPADLTLPDDTPVRTDSAWGALPAMPDGWMAWSDLRAILPLARSEGWACKLFTAPGSLDSVSVDAGEERLTVRVVDAPVPAVFGLWMNRSAIAGLDVHHLGVEAGFGDHDDLAACIADGSALPLSPGEVTTWHVRIEIAKRSAR